jgi:hypothetical protein
MKMTFDQGCIGRSLALCLAVTVARADIEIDSVDHNGTIKWSVSEAPSTCHVEWASSASGPWLRSWDPLKNIIVTGSSAEASIPLFFRVVRATSSLDFGLIFHMPCNGDLLDHSPFGNNPTPTGLVDLGPDRASNSSRALRVDLGEYLSVASSPSLVATNLTVALWVKFNTVSTWPGLVTVSPNGDVWSIFVDQVGATSTPGWMYLRGGAPSPALPLEETLQTNRWYHLAATVAGTNAVLYMDGVPRKTGTVAPLGNSLTTIYIGRHAVLHPTDPTSHWMFSGLMDDIRIYNRALDGTELAALHSLAP